MISWCAGTPCERNDSLFVALVPKLLLRCNTGDSKTKQELRRHCVPTPELGNEKKAGAWEREEGVTVSFSLGSLARQMI